MTFNNTKTAIVTGLGPAGASTATLLAAAGWNILGFEKRSAPTPGAPIDARGFAFTLSPTGLFSLSDSIRQAIEPHCSELSHRVFVDENGRRSTRPYGERPGDRLRAVPRSLFQEVALAAAKEAGATLEFDATVTEVSPRAGRVTVVKDGAIRTYEADLIIAADGAHSTVRPRLAAMANSSYSVDFDGVRYVIMQLSADEVARLIQMSGGLHFFSSPGGTDVLIPTLPQSTLLVISKLIPKDGFLTQAAAQSLAETRNPVIRSLVPSLAERLTGAPVGNFVTTRMTAPYGGKCVVVGDAWNAIPAYSGQGVNSALQDVKALTDALAASPDLPAALAAYSLARKSARDAVTRLNTAIGHHLMNGTYGSRLWDLKELVRGFFGIRSTYQKIVFDGVHVHERN